MHKVLKQIEYTADTSKEPDVKDPFWTTGLPEIQCFANLTPPWDCFTCSINSSQKRLQKETYPPIQQVQDLVHNKITQFSQHPHMPSSS